jgi:hypothetical protein
MPPGGTHPSPRVPCMSHSPLRWAATPRHPSGSPAGALAPRGDDLPLGAWLWQNCVLDLESYVVVNVYSRAFTAPSNCNHFSTHPSHCRSTGTSSPGRPRPEWRRSTKPNAPLFKFAPSGTEPVGSTR